MVRRQKEGGLALRIFFIVKEKFRRGNMHRTAPRLLQRPPKMPKPDSSPEGEDRKGRPNEVIDEIHTKNAQRQGDIALRLASSYAQPTKRRRSQPKH